MFVGIYGGWGDIHQAHPQTHSVTRRAGRMIWYGITHGSSHTRQPTHRCSSRSSLPWERTTRMSERIWPATLLALARASCWFCAGACTLCGFDRLSPLCAVHTRPNQNRPIDPHIHSQTQRANTTPPLDLITWLRRPMRRMNSPWIVVSAPMRKMPKTVTQARLRLMRKRKILPPISCHGECACMCVCEED